MSIALAWSDAVTAAQLFAVDPVGTGGVLLRSRAGPVRDRWLAMLRNAAIGVALIAAALAFVSDASVLALPAGWGADARWFRRR